MPAQSEEPLTTREKVALGVIILSGVGISLVAIVAISVGTYATSDANRHLVMTVFNTLAPMFGTWVATIIAFYFSRENFATAAKATRELVGQLGDDRLRQMPVRDFWIPAAAIEAITVEPGQESTIPFSEVSAKLSGRVSRLPVWDQNKVVRFVIHESMIFKFLAKQPPGAATAPTLETFLNFETDGTTMRAVVSRIAFVSQGATLADTKEKMTGVPDCQDVFVTATGQSSEPVLGWITNADIANKVRL